MNVLIVESNEGPGQIWSDHLRRMNMAPTRVCTQADAIKMIAERNFDVVILGMTMSEGRVFSIADYASYRRPQARIIYVAADAFFSDGSIFNFLSNACAMVPNTTSPADMAAIVSFHGKRAPATYTQPRLKAV